MKITLEQPEYFPAELHKIISGATYSGVPQTLLVAPVRYLDRPKSTILTWPSLSSRRFSGLRSL